MRRFLRTSEALIFFATVQTGVKFMLLVQEYTFEIVVLKLWHIGSVSVVKSLTHHVVSEG